MTRIQHRSIAHFYGNPSQIPSTLMQAPFLLPNREIDAFRIDEGDYYSFIQESFPTRYEFDSQIAFEKKNQYSITFSSKDSRGFGALTPFEIQAVQQTVSHFFQSDDTQIIQDLYPLDGHRYGDPNHPNTNKTDFFSFAFGKDYFVNNGKQERHYQDVIFSFKNDWDFEPKFIYRFERKKGKIELIKFDGKYNL